MIFMILTNCDVMDYVSTQKLNDVILNDIEALDGVLDGKDAQAIISNIEKDKAIREAFILANYSSLEVEDNLLNIYGLNDEGLSVNFTKDKNSRGSIVG